MVEISHTMLRCLPLLLACLGFPSVGLAHQLDEYMQAMLVYLEPKEVRFAIHLTPGVAVADQVLALIDRNHDGAISAQEARTYTDLVQQDLTVQLDGRKLVLRPAATYFPEPAELRTGWGFIQMQFSAPTGSLAPGGHTLSIQNRHQGKISAYLVNAILPKTENIRITRQNRNVTQSFGEIMFVVQ